MCVCETRDTHKKSDGALSSVTMAWFARMSWFVRSFFRSFVLRLFVASWYQELRWGASFLLGRVLASLANKDRARQGRAR